MTEDDPAPLEAEFDMLMRRAGIQVPADRRDAVFRGFVDLRRRVALLRGQLPADAQPAIIFTPLETPG